MGLKHTYPLSESQMGIVLEWIQHPDTTQNNISVQYDFPLDMDAERLCRAASTVFAKHAIFRTHIINKEWELAQYIDDEISIEVPLLYLSEEQYAEYRQQFIRPFNLWEDVLFRSAVVQTEKQIYLLNDTSHVIADSGTWVNFHHELDICYRTGSLEGIEDYPFSDVVHEDVQNLSSPAYLMDKDYYSQCFNGYGMTVLDTATPRAIGALKRISRAMPSQEVTAFCTAHSLTPNLFYMAVYSLVLSVLCGENKVSFEGMNHGRKNKRQRQTYGMFVKTVPFYADLTQTDTPVLELMQCFKHQMMQNVRHANYPFTHFCRDLHRQPSNSFSYQMLSLFIEVDGRQVPIREIPPQLSTENVSLVIYPNTDEDIIELCYNEARYSEAQMLQMCDMVIQVTQHIIHHPDATVGNVALVSESQQQELLELGSGEPLADAHSGMDVLELIQQQCLNNPDHIAIVDCESRMTYGELHTAMSAFSLQLQQSGVVPGDVVALLMPRRKEFMVAALGTLMLGATYVPVPTDAPQERIDFICQDSGACCTVNGQLQIQPLQGKPLEESGISYIIYTSGSTGKPKGVMISRRAMTSFVRSMAQLYQLSETDRILCQGTFSFDASVEDLYPVLTCGGTLHILRQSLTKDIHGIAQYIRQHAITGCNFTTVLGSMLLELVPDLPLRYMTLGGEKLVSVPKGLAFPVYNTYGPTEFTVNATYYICHSGQVPANIPIGRPLCQSMALVLDANARLLPKGCVGELYLAGAQIADGYVNLPEQTRKAFVPMPFANEKGLHTMYRTGDLVRWNADNQLEYVGRNDNQVKIRGYRIELGEIETAASIYPEVIQAVAQVCKVDGADQLCLWYTAAKPINNVFLRKFISHRLPEYMVPDWLEVISEIPLKANDKVDYARLPKPQRKKEKKVVMPAITATEDRLARLLSTVIGGKDISVTDDLFTEVGITSIQAARFSFCAMEQGYQLHVSDLYQWRNIRHISQNISRLPNHQESFAYWLEPPTDRPTVVLDCGYIYLHPLYTDYVEFYRERFNFLILESFVEYFWEKQEISLQQMMADYQSDMQRLLDGRQVDIVAGLCFGADLALLMAHDVCQWQDKKPLALLFDPIYHRAQSIDVIDEMESPIVAERMRISNALSPQVFPPEYQGPMLIMLAGVTPQHISFEFPDRKITEEEREALEQNIIENRDCWHTHYPDAEIHTLPINHFDLLKEDYLPEVVSTMKSSPFTQNL